MGTNNDNGGSPLGDEPENETNEPRDDDENSNDSPTKKKRKNTRLVGEAGVRREHKHARRLALTMEIDRKLDAVVVEADKKSEKARKRRRRDTERMLVAFQRSNQAFMLQITQLFLQSRVGVIAPPNTVPAENYTPVVPAVNPNPYIARSPALFEGQAQQVGAQEVPKETTNNSSESELGQAQQVVGAEVKVPKETTSNLSDDDKRSSSESD
eukprot:1172147-Prorocentrum_minimum.AAC.1